MGFEAEKNDLIHIGVQGMYWAEIALCEAFCFDMGDIWECTQKTYITNSHAQFEFENGTYAVVHMTPTPALSPKFAEITFIRTYNGVLGMHVDMDPAELPGYSSWLEGQRRLAA